MKFFEYFPTIQYTFDPDQQEFLTLVNIFTRVKVLDSILENSLVYYQYPYTDGDTLDGIASKYYNDPNRFWMVMFSNAWIDPYFDPPLSTDDFNNNIILKYGSIQNAQSIIYQYIQTQNVTTTQYGSSNTITYVSTVANTPYQYNYTTNELEAFTLPTLGDPVIDLGTVTVITSDKSTVTTDTQIAIQTAYDYEYTTNESKRQIQLIDAGYVGQIESQFQQLLAP